MAEPNPLRPPSTDGYWASNDLLTGGSRSDVPIWARPAVWLSALHRGLAAAVPHDTRLVARIPFKAAIGLLVLAMAVAAATLRPGVEWVYTESLLFMAIAVAVGLMLPTLAVAVVATYALFDLVWYFVSAPDHLVSASGGVARLVSHYLLWLLAVEIPVLQRQLQSFQLRGANRGRPRDFLEGLMTLGVTGLAVAVWTRAAPLLIRPVFVWSGRANPSVDSIAPLQTRSWVLLLTAVVVSLLSSVAYLRWGEVVGVKLRSSRLSSLRFWRGLRPTLYVAVIFLFAGMITSVWDVVVLLAAVAAADLVAGLVGGSSVLVAALVRIPLIVRMMAAFGVTYGVGLVVVGSWGRNLTATEFLPITVTVAIGLLAFRVLGVGAAGASSRQLPAPSGYPAPIPRDRSWKLGTLLLIGVAAGFLVTAASPALADNCSGMSDCYGSAAAGAAVAAAAAATAGAAVLGRAHVEAFRSRVTQRPARFSPTEQWLSRHDEVEILDISQSKEGWIRVRAETSQGQVEGWVPLEDISKKGPVEGAGSERVGEASSGGTVQLGARG